MPVRNRLATLVVIMMIGSILLVACSSGTNESANNNVGNSSETKTNLPDATKEAEKKVEKVYLYANYGQFSVQPDMSKPEALEEIKNAIIEKIGIEPVAIIPPKGSEADKLNMILAGNEPLDIFGGAMGTHQVNGAVMPLNDLMAEYGPNIRKLLNEDWDAPIAGMTTKDGKLWGIPGAPALAGNAVMIRSDWLMDLNLEVPKTFDDLEQVLKVFKEKDPAGNGQTIPMLTDYNGGMNGMNMAMAAGFMDNGYGNWIDSDGTVKHVVFNPGYREFIAKMAEWYRKGYIYKEAFSLNDRTKETEMVKQNRVGAAALWYSTVLNPAALLLLKDIDPDADYIVVDLQGPKGHSATMGGIGTGGAMISKNAQNPEAAMKYINWLYGDLSHYMLAHYGIEGKHWKWVDQSKGTFERLNNDYFGDFVTATSFAYTVQHSVFVKEFSESGGITPDREYIRDYMTRTDRVKRTGTADYEYKFDMKAISEQVPSLNDINRMLEQEVIKFVMGARPIEQYDNFLQELTKVGIDGWSKAYTDEYNKVK